jgi:hypothetical protein
MGYSLYRIKYHYLKKAGINTNRPANCLFAGRIECYARLHNQHLLLTYGRINYLISIIFLIDEKLFLAAMSTAVKR